MCGDWKRFRLKGRRKWKRGRGNDTGKVRREIEN
jgi:hypothetical protein